MDTRIAKVGSKWFQMEAFVIVSSLVSLGMGHHRHNWIGLNEWMNEWKNEREKINSPQQRTLISYHGNSNNFEQMLLKLLAIEALNVILGKLPKLHWKHSKLVLIGLYSHVLSILFFLAPIFLYPSVIQCLYVSYYCTFGAYYNWLSQFFFSLPCSVTLLTKIIPLFVDRAHHHCTKSCFNRCPKYRIVWNTLDPEN